MKKLFSFLVIVATCLSLALPAMADTSVRGYVRKDGTYVAPHMRSSPNNSYNDNWSVRGNVNPYTGKQGTRSPTYNDQTPYENQRGYGNPGYNNSSPYGSLGDDNDLFNDE